MAVEVIVVHDNSCGFIVPKEGRSSFDAADTIFGGVRGDGLLLGFVLFFVCDENEWNLVIVVCVVDGDHVVGFVVVIRGDLDSRVLGEWSGVGDVCVCGRSHENGSIGGKRRLSDGHGVRS